MQHILRRSSALTRPCSGSDVSALRLSVIQSSSRLVHTSDKLRDGEQSSWMPGWLRNRLPGIDTLAWVKTTSVFRSAQLTLLNRFCSLARFSSGMGFWKLVKPIDSWRTLFYMACDLPLGSPQIQNAFLQHILSDHLANIDTIETVPWIK